MANLSRRSFLKLSGGAAVLATIPKAVAGAISDSRHVPPLTRAISDVRAAGAEGIRIFHDEYDITVDCNGCTVSELYSFMSEHWRNDPDAITYPFPMMAVTPEYVEMVEGFQIDPAGWGNIKNGAVRLNEDEWLMGLISLGPDDGIITQQEFFAKYGPDDALAPLGNAPINMPVLVGPDVRFGELEIVDAKGRSYGFARDWGMEDHYRSGPVRWPLFAPKDHTIVPGEDDFVHVIDAWQMMGNTEAEAYALQWPDKYEMPPNRAWGKYSGPPIRRKS